MNACNKTNIKIKIPINRAKVSNATLCSIFCTSSHLHISRKNKDVGNKIRLSTVLVVMRDWDLVHPNDFFKDNKWYILRKKVTYFNRVLAILQWVILNMDLCRIFLRKLRRRGDTWIASWRKNKSLSVRKENDILGRENTAFKTQKTKKRTKCLLWTVKSSKILQCMERL